MSFNFQKVGDMFAIQRYTLPFKGRCKNLSKFLCKIINYCFSFPVTFVTYNDTTYIFYFHIHIHTHKHMFYNRMFFHSITIFFSFFIMRQLKFIHLLTIFTLLHFSLFKYIHIYIYIIITVYYHTHIFITFRYIITYR